MLLNPRMLGNARPLQEPDLKLIIREMRPPSGVKFKRKVKASFVVFIRITGKFFLVWKRFSTFGARDLKSHQFLDTAPVRCRTSAAFSEFRQCHCPHRGKHSIGNLPDAPASSTGVYRFGTRAG
jgi:hypothetical protein